MVIKMSNKKDVSHVSLIPILKLVMWPNITSERDSKMATLNEDRSIDKVLNFLQSMIEILKEHTLTLNVDNFNLANRRSYQNVATSSEDLMHRRSHFFGNKASLMSVDKVVVMLRSDVVATLWQRSPKFVTTLQSVS